MQIEGAASVKYLPLVWAGIWRKRSRAVLLLMQITTAFLLFGTLQGLSSGIHSAIAEAHGDRLFVTNRMSIQGSMLPIGLIPQIESIQGVRYITPQASMTGTYQQSDQSVPVVATDVQQYLHIYDEIQVSPGAVDRMRVRRDGGIVGSELMHRYGWKVGERIALQTPLTKSDNTTDWSFDILGSYEIPAHPENADLLIANFDYLNESRLADRDRATVLVVKVDDPANAGAISLAIDTAFANSDHETRTQSEGDRLATQIQQTADFDFIVRAIVSAVFFALLLATSALMMQSLREREGELAVLKTLGFPDRLILVLILVESILLCVFAASIGLFLAAFVLPRMQGQLTQVNVTHIPLTVLALGIGLAAALALISASAPALRGSRRQIVDALANR
jgi:putative ABC transport system permease protein